MKTDTCLDSLETGKTSFNALLSIFAAYMMRPSLDPGARGERITASRDPVFLRDQNLATINKRVD